MKNREAIIITKGEQFVNIDYSSGGYPIFTRNIFMLNFLVHQKKHLNM